MLPKQEYLKFHSMFYDAFTTLPPPKKDELVSYNCHELPLGGTSDAEWFIFSTMARDYIRELKNAINSFWSDIRRLLAWSKVYDLSPDECRFDFAVEILDSIASDVLNKPYIVQQRFIYTSSMLLYQTQMILDTGFDARKPVKESKIGRAFFHELIKEEDPQSKAHRLMDTILKIAGLDFKDSTGNFRNLYHHRIRRNIEVGVSPYVNIVEGKLGEQRKIDGSTLFSITHRSGNKTISYDICSRPPVKIGDALPLLRQQHAICVESFHTFWDWLNDLIKRWQIERGARTY